jgi:CheY-like chemotaxis protein
MLTANALAEHVTAGQEAGADGHLAKPITMASLFGVIDATRRSNRSMRARPDRRRGRQRNLWHRRSSCHGGDHRSARLILAHGRGRPFRPCPLARADRDRWLQTAVTSSTCRTPTPRPAAIWIWPGSTSRGGHRQHEDVLVARPASRSSISRTAGTRLCRGRRSGLAHFHKSNAQTMRARPELHGTLAGAGHMGL